MTKLDWDKADRRQPDPGAVVSVNDTGLKPIDDDHPFVPKNVRAKRAAIERQKLLTRSEKIRLEALARKKARITRERG